MEKISYLGPSKDHVQENFWHQLVVNQHLRYCLYSSITFDFFLTSEVISI